MGGQNLGELTKKIANETSQIEKTWLKWRKLDDLSSTNTNQQADFSKKMRGITGGIVGKSWEYKMIFDVLFSLFSWRH